MIGRLRTVPKTIGASFRPFSPSKFSVSRFAYQHQQQILSISRRRLSGAATTLKSRISNPGITQPPTPPPTMETRILKVRQDEPSHLGWWASPSNLNTWIVPIISPSTSILRQTALYLQTNDIPVAFPTETVYGLGADATRSAAVKGIYTAKGRPSDNPLIVHVCDLDMLRSLVGEIPPIYLPLIQRFWPGPLTILLPNGTSSPLAKEVTAGLATFGVRMPASALARTLIKLSGVPLAAPSANASTKPSPTTAQHVLDDLEGRIEVVLDGGACAVGVESTVVDGLCDPPVVLRPGGVSMEELRGVEGWEGVEKGYKDSAETGEGSTPRAPGMKYKHYSPRARVVLFEEGGGGERIGKGEGEGDLKGGKTVGVIRTGRWGVAGGLRCEMDGESEGGGGESESEASFVVREGRLVGEDGKERLGRILDVDLGGDVRGVAHGLFAALRELDRLGADVIFVEGLSDGDDIAAAVMNRLRKAASEIRG